MIENYFFEERTNIINTVRSLDQVKEIMRIAWEIESDHVKYKKIEADTLDEIIAFEV